MKISVIVPAFNMATTLPRAINSALQQCDEVVVVNDGSTDDTADVLAAIHHRKLRVRTQVANQGVCVARNTGITLADGDWFIPLDADDALNDNVVATLKAAADSRTFAYGDWLEVDAESGLPQHKQASPIGMIDRKNVAKATFLFSRSMWETVGGYDEDFETTGAEDWAFMAALLEAGFRGVRVEIPIYYYEPARDGRAEKVRQHEPQIRAMLRQKYPGVMRNAVIPGSNDDTPVVNQRR